MIRQRGFTYIEVMITLAIVAVLFIPMMRLFSNGLISSSISGEVITATSLARWEMERVKNLSLTTAQIKAEGDIWTPPMESDPLEVDKTRWRIHRRISGDSPLSVKVDVFQAENLKVPVATLETLLEDSVWVEERKIS